MHSTNKKNPEQADKKVDIICLSPHFDDVVLSVGSLMYQNKLQHKSILVVTVFTKSDALVQSLSISSFLKECNIKNATELYDIRSQEDYYALRHILIQNRITLGYIDGLFRTTPEKKPVYPNFHSLFKGKISSFDTNTRAQIVSDFEELKYIYAKPSTIVYAPLGIGNHADHLLVFEASRQVFNRIRFWEDIPYRNSAEALYTRLYDVQRTNIKLKSLVHDSAQNKHIKEKAIHAYKSQINGLKKHGLIDVDFIHEVIYEPI